MPSLLSQAEKDAYSLPFQDLHDTFSRQIVYFKEPDKVVISTDVNYNPYYDNIDESVEYIFQSGVISARILYNKDVNQDYSTPLGGNKESFRYVSPDGFARIKIRKEDYAVFEDAINITFDGLEFENEKTPRPHGLFQPNFLTLYLKIKK